MQELTGKQTFIRTPRRSFNRLSSHSTIHLSLIHPFIPLPSVFIRSSIYQWIQPSIHIFLNWIIHTDIHQTIHHLFILACFHSSHPLLSTRLFHRRITHTHIYMYIPHGLRLSPLRTSATNWPIVPAPDRWRMWSSLWSENWQGKPKYSVPP
jgi:hypothetical protein